MLISKFNKLIHNKLVWAAFAILVSLSMVGLFAPTVGDNGGSDNRIGTLFGDPVMRDELVRAKMFAEGFQPTRGGEEEQARMQEQAWQRMAIVRYARTLGVTVSDQEVTETIIRDKAFAVNGSFNRERYQQLIENQMRVPMKVFEDYLREELLLNKMQMLTGSSLWIAPYELAQSVARLTDRFTVDIVELTVSNLASNVTASDGDVRAFYDGNPSLFNAPELRSVVYVEWPLDELAKTVNVSEVQIQALYDRNIENYRNPETNAPSPFKPLSEVEDELRKEVAATEARSIASDYAMQFVNSLRMVDYGDAVSIHTVAAELKMNVYTTTLFSAVEPPSHISDGDLFSQAAFQLDAKDPSTSYSRAVVGDAAVYIMAWNTNRPAYLLTYDEVKDRARKLADQDAQNRAFETRLTDLQKQLSALTSTGTPFKVASESLKLSVKTVGPFSIYDSSAEEVDYFADIMPAVITLNAGQMSAPVRTDEATLLIHLVSREAGDQAEAIALKPDVNRMLQSTRMRTHFAAWSKALLANAKE